MKAFLLAAGLGTRLRPLTNQIPKCLVPIGSKPLLQIWLDLLARHDVDEVLINTHHLPDKVREFTATWRGKPAVRLVHEDALLGSAGTLYENWAFVEDEENVLVCYADNLTDMDLGALVHYHEAHCGPLTMALFHSDRPHECGIAELDSKGLVTSFEEKPRSPKSFLANCGVYVIRKDVAGRLPRHKPADIGFDILPQFAGQMYGWLWRGFFIDIGAPAAYDRAKKTWRHDPSGWTE